MNMNKTPSPALVKSKLSSSLKERLKKCGRYHASPEPAAKQPKIAVKTSKQEKAQNDSTLVQLSVTPQIKRQSLDVKVSTLHTVEEELSSCHSYRSPVLTSRSIHLHQSCSSNVEETKKVEETEKSSADTCFLNQTPLTQRSRSFKTQVIKASKLNFEDTCKEKSCKVQNKTSTCAENIENSKVISSEQSNVCELVHPDLCPSAVSSRSSLIKELELKEEQLRKLRMVKMYRSKNNLEELQTLIDKWRAVSQQALQDLYAAMPEPRPSFTELINHLGIDHQLLHFNEEDDETFF